MQRSITYVFFLAYCVWASVAGAQDQTVPRHVAEAQRLVRQLNLDDTSYEHGAPNVVWDGKCASHTDCSGFLDALLSRSYGYDAAAYKRWFNSSRPSARRYHDAIVDERGFTEIKNIAEAWAGDIVAIKYLIEKTNTGHVMLVVQPPHRMAAKEPLIPGTEQWQVTVIDSSMSGHGPTDTRHKRGANGTDHDGLGQGVFRIYTAPGGNIAGFAWSTLSASKFQQPAAEHLVVGRLKPAYRP
jgi:hypothetical protein